jgi:hypothetical protein
MLGQGDWGTGPLKKRIIEPQCTTIGGDVNYLILSLFSGSIYYYLVIYGPGETHKTMEKRKQMNPGY